MKDANAITHDPHSTPVDENSKRKKTSKNKSVRQHQHNVLVITDLVPSEMARLASSPGRISWTEVWISREEMVDFFE